MPSYTRNELFSLAYVRAVAAAAGYQIGQWDADDSSIDGTLRPLGRQTPMINFQAKSTTRDLVHDDGIHFPLPIKNYNDLRDDTENAPSILIVVLMPENEIEWLSQTTEELCLRHCGYFLPLQGAPELPNVGNRTVLIPLTNVFNRENLDDLMDRAKRGNL